MVSLEDEMKQKDKEAAVLKANHKYEMLLNIELERIEKCKRTYENFHHFEVAVMKDRHNRILEKQYELKVQKNASKLEIADLQHGSGITYQWNKSQTKMRTNGQYLSSNNQTNSAGNFDHTRKIPDRTNVTTSLSQPKGDSNYTIIPSERNDRSNVRRTQYANVVQYANNERTRTNAPATRHTNKPNFERDYFHESAHSITHTSSVEDAVKFPVLQSISSSRSKTPSTANFTSATSTVQRHTHFSENLTETHVIYSRDVHTPSIISGNFKKKKSHRAAVQDNLSPFDQYRLRLQESEQRTRKSKHHFTRAFSAMESTGRSIDDTLTGLRRARSADVK